MNDMVLICKFLVSELDYENHTVHKNIVAKNPYVNLSILQTSSKILFTSSDFFEL